MADDKRKQRQDRKLIDARVPPEVRYFAKKHGLTVEQAFAIIREHGPSRRKCNEAAEALRQAQS